MKYSAIKIDDLTINDHHHVDKEDECFYLMEYTKGAGYSDSVSSLIFNFKKSPAKKNLYEWGYKVKDINRIIQYFKEIYVPMIDLNSTTIVPIPPSKCKSDPLYDDRMVQVLNGCFPGNADIRELILTKISMEPSHNSEVQGENRPSLEIIQNNLILNEECSDGVKDKIILFDDVITVGTHFKACKNIIRSKFPGKEVYGMFIARRAIPQLDTD